MQVCFPHSLHSTRRPWPYPLLYQSLIGQSHTSDASSHASVFFKVANISVPVSGGIKRMSRVAVPAAFRPTCLFSLSPCCKQEDGGAHPPEAWTSMMYWCRSCPCWMTSKVMLFMASFRSVWRCSRCSASVRSSVLKSFICRSRSSFQASSSAVTCKGVTVRTGSQVHEKLQD